MEEIKDDNEYVTLVLCNLVSFSWDVGRLSNKLRFAAPFSDPLVSNMIFCIFSVSTITDL